MFVVVDTSAIVAVLTAVRNSNASVVQGGDTRLSCRSRMATHEPCKRSLKEVQLRRRCWSEAWMSALLRGFRQPLPDRLDVCVDKVVEHHTNLRSAVFARRSTRSTPTHPHRYGAFGYDATPRRDDVQRREQTGGAVAHVVPCTWTSRSLASWTFVK